MVVCYIKSETKIKSCNKRMEKKKIAVAPFVLISPENAGSTFVMLIYIIVILMRLTFIPINHK